MFPFIQKRQSASVLAQMLIKSLRNNDGRWLLRKHDGVGPLTLEFRESDDVRATRFTVKIVPCRGSCMVRLGCFETAELRVDGNKLNLPPLARCRLKNAAELFALRYGLTVARRLIA